MFYLEDVLPLVFVGLIGSTGNLCTTINKETQQLDNVYDEFFYDQMDNY